MQQGNIISNLGELWDKIIMKEVNVDRTECRHNHALLKTGDQEKSYNLIEYHGWSPPLAMIGKRK